jgi:Arc/MetJ-type ribon-helix-helix transcriptional regulator
MQRITIRLPEQQLKMIDWLVECGEFPSASEAIRTAIRDMIDQRTEKLRGKIQLFEDMQTISEESPAYLKLNKRG